MKSKSWLSEHRCSCLNMKWSATLREKLKLDDTSRLSVLRRIEDSFFGVRPRREMPKGRVLKGIGWKCFGNILHSFSCFLLKSASLKCWFKRALIWLRDIEQVYFAKTACEMQRAVRSIRAYLICFVLTRVKRLSACVAHSSDRRCRPARCSISLRVVGANMFFFYGFQSSDGEKELPAEVCCT